MSILEAATLVVLLLVLPGLAVAQARALKGVHVPKIPAYVSSAATLVVLGGWCGGVSMLRRGPAAVGLVAMPVRLLVGWTVAVTVAGLALMLCFRILAGALGIEESATLRGLLPETAGERVAFAGLSLMAGLCEEIVFRGYALPVLAGSVGVLAAGAVTSVTFGILHAYQGAFGMVRTAALGGVLAWAFVAAGSLWPVVAAHAGIDLLGGIVLADRLMSPERTHGVL